MDILKNVGKAHLFVQLEKNCLGILLVHFCPYFNNLTFLVNRMDKTEKSTKMLGDLLVDFLPILYQKVKKYFGLSIRPI